MVGNDDRQDVGLREVAGQVTSVISCTARRTWLFVMEENRKIAEGSERKKAWAAERK